MPSDLRHWSYPSPVAPSPRLLCLGSGRCSARAPLVGPAGGTWGSVTEHTDMDAHWFLFPYQKPRLEYISRSYYRFTCVFFAFDYVLSSKTTGFPFLCLKWDYKGIMGGWLDCLCGKAKLIYLRNFWGDENVFGTGGLHCTLVDLLAAQFPTHKPEIAANRQQLQARGRELPAG